MADPERVEDAPLRPRHVARRERRERPPVRTAGGRIARRGAGGAVTTAEQVRAEHADAVGVESLAGPDDRRPPVARSVGRSGERVDEEDLGGVGGTRAVVTVCDVDAVEDGA